MFNVLLLNATYEPLKVISWQRAITLLTLGKVEVIEEYDREVRSVSFVLKMPSVVRLLRFIRAPKQKVRFSRHNIYARDKFSCQYCRKPYPSEDLTYDHVIPRARGGLTEWTNIVTSCISCNKKKGGRTPEEAGMKLLRKPETPHWVPAMTITMTLKQTPESWRDYLYWNVELER
ncbi:MAG: HNH endonuclease [Candidatus Tectomicrobia bacterium]|nr:HNH endonuclease [Candidatus Tectomicrobia bacterium]